MLALPISKPVMKSLLPNSKPESQHGRGFL
jgi:hypothetical protein